MLQGLRVLGLGVLGSWGLGLPVFKVQGFRDLGKFKRFRLRNQGVKGWKPVPRGF